MAFALQFAQPPAPAGPAPAHVYDPARQQNVLMTGQPVVSNLDRAQVALLTNCTNPTNGQTVYNDD